jgi:uncharacterized protein with HEPN domain
VSRDEAERLRDIRDAIAAIHAHLGRLQDEPTENERILVHDAVLYQFVVIGEATKNLSVAVREATLEIPWEDVAGLRDLIAHEYFRIEMDRVIRVVERDLPPLQQAIEHLLDDDR